MNVFNKVLTNVEIDNCRFDLIEFTIEEMVGDMFKDPSIRFERTKITPKIIEFDIYYHFNKIGGININKRAETTKITYYEY